MGLLENLAAIAIRSKVIAALKENCPETLQAPLQQLLDDPSAVAAIQGLVAGNLSNPAAITPAAVLALPFPAAIRQLLGNYPDLVHYLVDTAKARLPH